jgi:hypothetical protein
MIEALANSLHLRFEAFVGELELVISVAQGSLEGLYPLRPGDEFPLGDGHILLQRGVLLDELDKTDGVSPMAGCNT